MTIWVFVAGCVMAALWLALSYGFEARPANSVAPHGDDELEPEVEREVERAVAENLSDSAYLGAAQKTYKRYEVDICDVVLGLSPDLAAAQRAKIAEYRAKSEALADPRWRNAHLSWVRYAEDGLARAEQNWATIKAEKAAAKIDPLRNA